MAGRTLGWAFLMTAVLAASGCVSEGDGGERPTGLAPSPAGALVLEEPTLVHSYGARGQHEVYVDVSPDGQTVLTCGHGQFERAAHYFASTDGGATWDTLAPFPDPVLGGDCEVAIGADGAWYFLTSTIAGATVSTTQDQGATWFTTPLAAIPIGGLADRPWMETVGDTVILSFMPTSMQPGMVAATRSTDHGRTWEPPQYLSFLDGGDLNAVNLHPQVLAEGKMRIPLVQYTETQGRQLVPHPTTLAFAETDDAGATWRRVPAVGPIDGVIDLVFTVAQSGDNAYFVFQQEIQGRRRIAEVHSTDGGRSWSEPATLVADAPGASIPASDARPDGSVVVGIVIGDEPFTVSNTPVNTLHVFDLHASAPSLVRAHSTLGNASYLEFPVAFDHDAVGNGWFMQLDHQGALLQRKVWFVTE